MRPEIPPLVGILTRRDDATCELLTGAPSVSSLAFHIAQLTCDFTVLEPEELIAELRQVSLRLQRSTDRMPNADAGKPPPLPDVKERAPQDPSVKARRPK
jgi:hypothetical protein